MRHILKYNGRSTLDFGVHISGEDTWRTAAPDLERTSIPGRSGDLVSFNNRYKNVDITYHMGIIRDFDRNYSAFTNFMLSTPGYHRLEDSYHPEVYRLALMEPGFAPEMAVLNRQGQFDVKFSCKPQAYLKSGERTVEFTQNGSIYNPTMFDALPLMRIYGEGVLGIGRETIRITMVDSYIDVDCELEDAYKEFAGNNRNRFIVLSGDSFPSLPPGETTITLGTGITKVMITPRWWML